MTATKYLLVKGSAGLGNRVFSLLTAVLYARLTQRRLMVDWSDPTYSSDGANVVHQFFTSPFFSPTGEIPATESVRPAIWRGHLRESAFGIRGRYAPELVGDPLVWKRFSVEISKLGYPEEVLVFWTFFPLIGKLRRHFRGIVGELRDLDDMTILRRLMRESLQLHPAIRARVDGLRSNWPAGPVIGVHVRSTDRATRLEAIRERVDNLRAHQPDAPVFLATDSRAVELAFARDIPGLLTAPKWYPGSGERLHFNAECPDKAASGVEALVDLYLLAGCDELVLDTSSSFALLARILADSDRSRVYDVYRWRAVPPGLRSTVWRMRQSLKWGPRRLRARLRR